MPGLEAWQIGGKTLILNSQNLTFPFKKNKSPRTLFEECAVGEGDAVSSETQACSPAVSKPLLVRGCRMASGTSSGCDLSQSRNLQRHYVWLPLVADGRTCNRLSVLEEISMEEGVHAFTDNLLKVVGADFITKATQHGLGYYSIHLSLCFLCARHRVYR